MKYQYYHFIASANLIKKARGVQSMNAEKPLGGFFPINCQFMHLKKKIKEKSKPQLF